MDDNTKHPIQLLHDIEQLSVRIAKGLPQREDIKEHWSGIAFRIGEFQFVAPLQQVNEVLHYPVLTTFPGTKSWVKGIANIRGSLVPVMDLSAYLGKKHIGVNNQSRILVIHRDSITVGLLIDDDARHILQELPSRSGQPFAADDVAWALPVASSFRTRSTFRSGRGAGTTAASSG